jgi:hypothetical protein
VRGTTWVVVWLGNTTGSSNSVSATLGGRAAGSTVDSSAGPISFPIDTTVVGNGTQTLSVSARDASGNTGTGSVTVTVAN